MRIFAKLVHQRLRHELRAVVGGALALHATAALLAAQVVPTKRNIGGVVTAEHDARAFVRAPQFVLDAIPITMIGGATGNPDYDLTWVGDAALLRDGRVATFSSIGSNLFIFGADGTAQRKLGGVGKAPGQIMAASGLTLLRGDTIVVFDAGNRRIDWFLPDKGLVLDTLATTLFGSGADHVAGFLRGGDVVLHGGGMVRSEGVTDVVSRPKMPVYAVKLPGGPAREILQVPDLETVLETTNYRGRAGRHSTVIRGSRRASIAVWDTVLAVGSGDGYTIDIHASSGSLMSRIRVAAPRIPMTQVMRDALVAAELKRYNGPHMEALVDPDETRRLARAKPSSDSLPPYDAFFVTPNKTLWVLDGAAITDTSWSATGFRSDGAIVARLNGSGSERPITFGDDRVLVRSEDADGVIALKVYRIRPR